MSTTINSTGVARDKTELAKSQFTAGATAIYSETLDEPSNERDALGRVVARTEATPSGIDVWRYTYDPRGQLTVVTLNDELYERLTYDLNGNRIRRETPDEDIAATYDDQDRLLTYGKFAYTYTANGELWTRRNVDSGAVTTYEYDVRGNLVRVALPSGDIIEYVLDGLDRRVAKNKNGVAQRRWLYLDKLRIAAELDGTGNVLCRFVYASGSNVPDLIVRQDGTHRIVKDHAGSPRVVVNVSTGAVAQEALRDAWGAVITSGGVLPFGFAGGLTDSDTGFVRFGHAYDSPGIHP